MNTATIDQRLTHRIICESGQWARGKTEADARAEFKRIHSSRHLKDAQVWAVTPNTRINEHGQFSAPRAEYVAPVCLTY